MSHPKGLFIPFKYHLEPQLTNPLRAVSIRIIDKVNEEVFLEIPPGIGMVMIGGMNSEVSWIGS